VTTDERIDRLTGIVEKMAGAVNTLAGAVIARDNQIEAHDRQIEALIKIAEIHDEQIAKQGERIDRLVREWQAYLTRVAPM
jgi:hypothetical protein